jgi:hypothetical protein
MTHAELNAAVRASLDRESHCNVYPPPKKPAVVVDPRTVSRPADFPRVWR